MPIYEFICQNCQSQFDKLVPMDWEKAGVTCPECASTKLDKAVSRVGFSGQGVAVSGGGDACGTCHTGSCSTCN